MGKRQTQIDIIDFDSMCKSGEFAEGPFIETFGDGYGHPYNPARKVWGRLIDGQEVCAITRNKPFSMIPV